MTRSMRARRSGARVVAGARPAGRVWAGRRAVARRSARTSSRAGGIEPPSFKKRKILRARRARSFARELRALRMTGRARLRGFGKISASRAAQRTRRTYIGTKLQTKRLLEEDR